MGLFSSLIGFEYILVAVDYVSKQVEVIPIKTNDANSIINFLKDLIINTFGTSWVIPSDGGNHFFNKLFGSS